MTQVPVSLKIDNKNGAEFNSRSGRHCLEHHYERRVRSNAKHRGKKIIFRREHPQDRGSYPVVIVFVCRRARGRSNMFRFAARAGGKGGI